jgi:hypothetical protein
MKKARVFHNLIEQIHNPVDISMTIGRQYIEANNKHKYSVTIIDVIKEVMRVTL